MAYGRSNHVEVIRTQAVRLRHLEISLKGGKGPGQQFVGPGSRMSGRDGLEGGFEGGFELGKGLDVVHLGRLDQ